jgi:hypothetical protein
MAITPKKQISVRYRTVAGQTYLKNVFYRGISLRESDGSTILTLALPGKDKRFTIDIGQVDTIRVDGKTHRLKSPGHQHKFREAELRHLLEGEPLEEWTAPYLAEYVMEGGVTDHGNPLGLLGRGMMWLFTLAVMAVPIIAAAIVGGGLLYIAWVLFTHMAGH